MLREETCVAQALECAACRMGIGADEFPHSGIRESLASCGVHEQNPVSRIDQPPCLHFPYPRSLG